MSVAAAGINAADLMQRARPLPGPARERRPTSPDWSSPARWWPSAPTPPATAWATGSWASPAGAARPSWWWCPRPSPCPCPTAWSWDQAGGFPEAFSTAYDALFTQARLGAGDRVLISGAAGGVGTAAVQLAHAAGAHVVASVRVRGPSARRGPHSAADDVIDPDEVADHGPYDVSLELVGGANVAAVLPLMAAGDGSW